MAIHDRKPRTWSDYDLALITEVTERSWAHVERVRSEAELRQLNVSLEARIADEVSRKTEAQAALLQSQKMETVGQLTGGVAHDFNNLLTPIVGALEIAHRRAGEDERLRQLTAGGLQAADRARTLVQRLLAFSRRQHLEPRPVDLGSLLEGMRDLIARSLGPEIDLSMEAETGLCVLVDPNQLELALLNLAVNARDAMPEGGRLVFKGWRDEQSLVGDPDWVHVAVTDNGQGMDPHVLGRAVEPFFTTKEVGKGTGLGLSAVQGLALQSGGGFRLESTPGEGTVATLSFPALEPNSGATAPSASRPSPVRLDGVTVLLVDDEELVRSATAAMLTEAGATVLEAKSGLAGLAMLRQGMKPDVLVTDYAMPGINGAVLAREAREERADLPVLLITGYASLAETSAGLPRLSKPFTEARLTTAVAEVISGGAAEGDRKA
jgi:signal transduction histidine kinase